MMTETCLSSRTERVVLCEISR